MLKIVKKHYINEKELVLNQINQILISFEGKTKSSINKELEVIENIKTKLKNSNMTVKKAMKMTQKSDFKFR